MMYMKKNKAFWPYLVRKNTYIREYDLFKSRLAHHRRSKLSIACSDFFAPVHAALFLEEN